MEWIEMEKTDLDELISYVQHDSWRCDYYQICHCGLDALFDKLKLPRVPFEGKYQSKKEGK